MGACCCKGANSDATPSELLVVTGLGKDLNKQSRVVIVGGGPSGIHMASRLSILGFTNVIVLERNGGRTFFWGGMGSPALRLENGGGPPGSEGYCGFGKTFTLNLRETGDCPHEMGTCYLSWSYHLTRRYLKEYLGPDSTIVPGGQLYGGVSMVSPNLDRLKQQKAKTHSADEYLYANAEAQMLPDHPGLWKFLPDKLQAVNFLIDVKAYRSLHEQVLGKYDYHGLPPEPGPKALKMLNMTYREFMIKHGQKVLLELTAIGFGSYGFGYHVPALYGLWFVTPMAVEAYLASKLDKRVETVALVKKGYDALWRAMVEKHKIEVRYGVEVESICRNLDDPQKPVTVAVKGSEPVEADVLVFAAPMWTEFLRLVKDPTPFERQVCNSLSTVGLHVALWETEKKETDATAHGERSLTFYPESLNMEDTPDPMKDMPIYAERNSVRAFRPDQEPLMEKRYSVSYQYLPKYVPNASLIEGKCREFMTSKDKAVDPTPPGQILIYQKNWDYFPTFSQEAINELLPWKLLERQGEAKTWYVGSSCCFESVEDVMSYNNLLLSHKFPGAKELEWRASPEPTMD